jgi:SAM-dependent methyltransferase
MSMREEASSGSSVTSYEESLDPYEEFAKYYDVWLEEYTEDIGMYLELAERSGGAVLLCMCGTGRLLIALAKDGFEVVGLDRSSAMLDHCTAKLELMEEDVGDRVDIVQDDIRSFDLPDRFNLAIVPQNTFVHLLETEDQESALTNVRAHLNDGGILIVALENPRLLDTGLRHRGTRTTSHGEIISRFESQEFDLPEQLVTVHHFYDISKQDRQVKRVTVSFVQRVIFLREATDLLKRCGFEVAEVYGDYTMSPFKRTSEKMILVARKTE